MSDLVIALREIRRNAGLSQKDLALKTGVGEKTISSFETGQRIGSLKVNQLTRIVVACGLDIGEFFTTFLAALEGLAGPLRAFHVPKRQRSYQKIAEASSEFISIERFNGRERRLLSQVALLLGDVAPERQDLALAFLAQGSSLIPTHYEEGRPDALIH